METTRAVPLQPSKVAPNPFHHGYFVGVIRAGSAGLGGEGLIREAKLEEAWDEL
jgi:hypothetical protein